MSSPQRAKRPGKVITFYSYKGGTGRSMAVANIAWILACNRKRVLVLDWDLEAPGLHRYFRPFLIDKDIAYSEGIIDFVAAYAAEAIKPLSEGETLPEDWYVPHANILRYVMSLDWEFPEGGALDFIPAGQQVSTYSVRVSSFNWSKFYERLGGQEFIDAARKLMCAEYDYVLIDSRTGVSDTAGICTVQMPDTLVCCFTYNNQSMEGAAAVAESVTRQRGGRRLAGVASDFHIFPVPMRVDPGSNEKLSRRKRYARRLFDRFTDHMPEGLRAAYWDRVEVPYVYDFTYEEVLATFQDSPTDPKNVLSAMLRLTNYLASDAVSDLFLLLPPDKREKVIADFRDIGDAETDDLSLMSERQEAVEEHVRTAETIFIRLSDEEQGAAEHLWTRLVEIKQRGGNIVYAPAVAEYDSLDEPLRTVASAFISAGLLRLRETRRELEVVSDDIIGGWPRLKEWAGRDTQFLLWRQRLIKWVQEWEIEGHGRDFLLERGHLRTATSYLQMYNSRLTGLEKRYIAESIENDKLHEKHWFRRIGYGLLVIIAIIALYVYDIRNRNIETKRTQSSQAALLTAQGLNSARNNDLDTALTLYTTAINLDQRYAEAYYLRSQAYVLKNDYTNAFSDIKKVTELEPGNVRYKLKSAETYLAAGDFNDKFKVAGVYKEARSVLNNLIQKRENYENLPQRQVGDAAAPPVDTDFIAQFDALRPQIYYARGNANFALGEFEGAINDYSKALDANPNFSREMLLRRSRAYTKIGKYEEADADQRRAAALVTPVKNEKASPSPTPG